VPPGRGRRSHAPRIIIQVVIPPYETDRGGMKFAPPPVAGATRARNAASPSSPAASRGGHNYLPEARSTLYGPSRIKRSGLQDNGFTDRGHRHPPRAAPRSPARSAFGSLPGPGAAVFGGYKRAHTRTAIQTDLLWRTLRVLQRPKGVRTVESKLQPLVIHLVAFGEPRATRREATPMPPCLFCMENR
jgi:hypothetical protein